MSNVHKKYIGSPKEKSIECRCVSVRDYKIKQNLRYLRPNVLFSLTRNILVQSKQANEHHSRQLIRHSIFISLCVLYNLQYICIFIRILSEMCANSRKICDCFVWNINQMPFALFFICFQTNSVTFISSLGKLQKVTKIYFNI